MESILILLAFINGLALGAGGMYLKQYRPKVREAPEDRKAARIAQQYENFLNYDGTERGQKSIEG